MSFADDNSLKWLGSIAWDGYEIDNVSTAKTPDEYKLLLTNFLSKREDATLPDMGWPWPWNNSKLTDECYIFMNDEVWRVFKKIGAYEDHTTPLIFVPFHDEQEYDEDKYEWIEPKKSLEICVPDMKEKQKVTLGRRSGVTVLGVSEE